MAPTKKQSEPNCNNSIITIQRLHLRKSTLQEHPNINTIEQHFPTPQHFPTFTMLSYTISKMSPVSESVVSSTHIYHNIPWRLTHGPMVRMQKPTYPENTPRNILTQDNGLREGVGEYSAEYSPYSRNKTFTPILPLRTIFSPILYLPARPDLSLYYSQPPIRIYCPRN